MKSEKNKNIKGATHLMFNLRAYNGDKHWQDHVKEDLKIGFLCCVPQTMFDAIVMFSCSGNVKDLPDYIDDITDHEKIHADPFHWINACLHDLFIEKTLKVIENEKISK